jgi:hypothetical protein
MWERLAIDASMKVCRTYFFAIFFLAQYIGTTVSFPAVFMPCWDTLPLNDDSNHANTEEATPLTGELAFSCV